MKDHKIYYGKKFYKDISGYWKCTRNPKLYAHRLVWTMFYGEIPSGMVIHHIDGNTSNNEITNLQMLHPSDHKKFHWRKKRYDPRQLWLPF